MQIRRASLLLLCIFLSAAWSQDIAPAASPIEKLVRALLEAPTDAERDALLAEHSEVRPSDLCQALLAKSEDLRVKAAYPQAHKAAELALKVAEKAADQKTAGAASFQMGKIHYYRSEYPEAVKDLTKSLSIREQEGDPASLAQTLTFLGKTAVQQEQNSEAFEYFEKSLAISRPAGSAKETAETLNALCFLDQNEAQFSRAASNCAESLALRRQIGDRSAIAESLMATGRLQYLQEKYDAALESYQESLKLYEELGYAYYIGYVETCLGTLYLAQENYILAMEAYEKGLSVSQAVGDQRTAASALETIGEIHSAQGNYDVALEYFQKALRSFQELGLSLYVGVVQDLIGQVYMRQEKIPEAVEWMNRAMQTYKQVGSTRNIAFLHIEFGDLYLQQHDYEAARKSFENSLDLAKSVGVLNVQASAQKNLGRVAYLQGDFSRALQFSRQAAAMGAELKHNEIQWQSLQVTGQTLAAMGKTGDAQQAFERSIGILEDSRLKVAGGEQDRQRFLASRMEPYYAMIDFLVTQENFREAFTFAERAKARVLLEALSGTRNNPERLMTAAERGEDARQADQMADLNRQILQESQKPGPDAALLKRLSDQLKTVRGDHEAFFSSLYALHPELRIQRGEIPSVSLEDAASLIPDPETGLLEYAVTEDRTYLFALSAGAEQQPPAIQVFSIKMRRQDLAKKVESFRERLAAQNLDFVPASRELYELLIGPASDFLRGKRNLLIVPDGDLWNLPFAALRSPENRYLLEDCALIEVPSMAALQAMQKARRKPDTAAPTLLAFGNPTAASGSTQRVKELYRGTRLGPLPDAEKEVHRLAAIYGASNSRIYVGKEAQEDRFKSEAGNYRILHIATHGILNDTAPLYSQLVLAPGQGRGSEDGLLEAWEIMNLKLHADLAVLSACETGRGRVGSGEGVIGLSWALLVAGVPTTVVSQWKVESTSTTDLMVSFHENLVSRPPGANFPVAAALRQAALRSLKHPAFKHPFYWAGFVVIGAAS